MRFTIVTPSFRNLGWLKLCIRSVADQDLEHEHIIQDSCSDDGTPAWLAGDSRVTAFIEKDAGMYDAVNRGFRRARGQLLAYLNCDEQYLPGALRRASEFFERHPAVDVVLGDVVVVDPAGHYVCERRSLTPQVLHTHLSNNLSFLTAGLFLRRRVFDQHGLSFDPALRDIGDAAWTVRAIAARVRMAVLGQFTSSFADTGRNMNTGPNATREKQEFFRQAPWWAQKLKPLIVAHYRLRRWRAGYYRCRPHTYAIYTEDSPNQREAFQVDKPTYRWKGRL